MAVSNAYALVIGISKYKDERVPALTYTHSDAEDFYHLLLDKSHYGIPDENIMLLLDEQATLFNIKNAISGWLYQHATDSSTVLIFYAGHGGIEASRTGAEKDGMSKYLLPWDTNTDNLFASALSNNSFNSLLSTIPSQRMVIFMDACYSGGVAQKGARDLGIVGNPYERLAEGQGRLVISAAKPNQLSWEDKSIGHGIFTYHLLEALSGKADTDNDGYVSVMEVFQYLEKHVPDTARRLAKSEQQPLLCGDLAKDIILTVDRKRISELQLKKKKEQQRHNEEIRKRRQKLFELYNEGHLPQQVFEQAIELVGKPEKELSAKEHKLKGLTIALVNDGLQPALYLASLEAMTRQQGEVKTNQPADTSVRRSESGHSKKQGPKTASKFCIHCGSRIIEGKRFCIGCGAAYRQ